MGPRNEGDEQMAVRHADASGGDITENQHEENRMRDIHIGKRGSETANEEKPDKLRKDSKIRARSSEYIVIFRSAGVSGISCEW